MINNDIIVTINGGDLMVPKLPHFICFSTAIEESNGRALSSDVKTNKRSCQNV